MLRFITYEEKPWLVGKRNPDVVVPKDYDGIEEIRLWLTEHAPDSLLMFFKNVEWVNVPMPHRFAFGDGDMEIDATWPTPVEHEMVGIFLPSETLAVQMRLTIDLPDQA